MGNRSYLSTEQRGEITEQLESNNLLPLLWIALLDKANVERFGEPATRDAGDGPGYGFTLDIPTAIANLERRRALLARWPGAAAGVVVDQFAQLLRDAGAGAGRVVLDLTEYVDGYDSADTALAFLRKAVDALDADAAKSPTSTRRPPKVKWLMDEFSLSGVADTDPLFGIALAGSRADDSEPWHRDPPRRYRVPGARMRWANDDRHVSADGRVVVASMSTLDYLFTPLIWNRDAGTVTPMPIPDSVEALSTHLLSPDGRVLIGNCVTYPGQRSMMFRYADGKLELLPPASGFHAQAASQDGAVLAGTRHQAQDWSGSARACRLVVGGQLEELVPGEVSYATHITPDGRVVAGTTCHGSDDATTTRAFTWSADGGLHDLGIAHCGLKWLRLAPDGASGLLVASTQRVGGSPFYLHWRCGQPVREIPQLDSESNLTAASAAADALLGTAAGKAALWTSEGGLRMLDLSGLSGVAGRRPLFVADGGAAGALTLSPVDTNLPEQIATWSEADGVRQHAVARDPFWGRAFWGQRSRAAQLAQFVAVGHWSQASRPVIWSPQDGVQSFPYEFD